VLIQHLDPTHESQLAELLARATPMPVTEVRRDTPVAADHVYVLSPGKGLRLANGVLHVLPRPDTRSPHLPIDDFFRSLAADQDSNAFGIILSGTAADGTLGLKALKAEGGITFAQDPHSAKFDSMPRSAVAAGVVDFVLPPAEIARQVVTLARHPYVHSESETAGEPRPAAEADLNRMFAALRTATGVDFRQYKRNTVQRRLRRRMALRGMDKLHDYILYLRRNPAEVHALQQDLLVTVTAFFREPAAFAALRHTVFPQLIAKRSADDLLRIWVPGCATGEEVYSLAMDVTEFLEEAAAPVRIQVFATDLSEPAIEKARAGVYAESALGNMTPERRQRFFVKTDGNYQISKALRELCVFAKHNVTEDPPFSRVDLISCCNLLIYFGPVLQRRVLAKFHYALKPTGFLLLGSSESVGASADLFRQVGKKHKIYAKNPSAARLTLDATASDFTGDPEERHARRDEPAKSGPEVQKEADRLVLAEYAPAGLIIDEELNILHVRGHTGPYLELAPGEPSQNLFRMVREGLLGGLRTALRKAQQQHEPVREEGVRVKAEGHIRQVTVRVIPLKHAPATARCFLILFEEVTPPPTAPGSPARLRSGATPGQGKHRGDQRELTRVQDELAAAHQELAGTKEYLQSIIEEQEAATEELKSANEEAQASNEELETAKEELQSANEELTTLNDELKIRNAELSQLTSDLTNLLASLDIPLVMVGKDLRIRRFTPAMEPLLNLIASDLGRALTDLRSNLHVPDLPHVLEEVIARAQPTYREIQDAAGHWYTMRVLPYVGPENTIDGAVLLLVDIDAIKRSRDYTAALVETVREPLVVLTADLHVRSANKAFYETFQVTAAETENRLFYELSHGQWNIPTLRQALEDILLRNSRFEDLEVEQEFVGVGRKVLRLNAHQVAQPGGDESLILLAMEDNVARKQTQEQLERMNEDLKHFAYAASHELQEPLRMVTSYTQLLAKEYAGTLDAEARDFIAYAVEGALRMEALLRGLQEYWQVSDSAGAPRTAFDCNQVLEEVLQNLQAAMTESGAVVTHDPLPTVVAEEAMLVQLFQNLIGNALKYRSELTPQIHVSAQAHKGEWRFSVQDNGIGIAPQHTERVFGMFTHLHGHKYPGTGIGLALCRKLVERHGGRIWVESEPGTGSTFFFTLPAREEKR
jgi:two-component system CheB/CheR fusion protein